MNEQHDDHCWVTYDGCQCKIQAMAGLDMIATVCSCGKRLLILDLSEVDWGLYCAAARDAVFSNHLDRRRK